MCFVFHLSQLSRCEICAVYVLFLSKCHSPRQLAQTLSAILYVIRTAALKLWMLSRAALTVNDGTESSHLSQLHLPHCWLHCLGQLI